MPREHLIGGAMVEIGSHLAATKILRADQKNPQGNIKVLHIAFTWWPDASGGTEVYVKGLVGELQKMGVENVVAAPEAGRSEIADGISDKENRIEDRGSRIKGVKRSQGEDKIRVWRFRCSDRPGDLGEIYGEGDPVAAQSFNKVLDEEKPDIVHFHAWSPAVSILLVREVKRRGIRIVQTYHTPTLSCPRGTLMRWGKTVCDGDLARRPCALCAIQGKLIQRHRMPDTGYRIPGAGKSLDGASLNLESEIRNPERSKLSAFASKLTTMIRMPGLIRKRTEVVRELFRTADKMVALNQWTKELLRVNGVEEGKIEVIRHGVPEAGGRIGPLRPAPARPSNSLRDAGEIRLRGGIPDSGSDKKNAERLKESRGSSRKDAKDAKGVREIPETGDRRPDSGNEEDSEYQIRNPERVLKLVFLGRVAPEKGIDVLLKAMEMVKIPVELDVYGIKSDAGYGIRDSGGGKKPECKNPKARIQWLEAVKPEAVVETIRKYDALVVPSVWLETGPLVVLEAFAAGVPVIGSRLGGIAETVRDGVDGFLFQPGNPSDLAYDIEQIPRQLAALRENIKKPKGVTLVAEEHVCLYRGLV